MNFLYTRIDKEMISRIMILTWIFHGMIIIYLISGTNSIKGSKRWIFFCGISYQPSELLKVSCLVCLNYFFRRRNYLTCLSMLSMTIFLLFKQPDLGSVLILSLVTLVHLTIKKLNRMFLIAIYFVLIITVYVVVENFPHAKNRFISFYSQHSKEKANAYQNTRALIAIKNGGFNGVGLGNGSIKTTLPDAYSDFIFAVIAEELGFIGCLSVCLSYLLFFIRCIHRSAEKDSTESDILVSISTLIAVQSWLHMATNVWLIPTKGTTLPCISHGGASFIVSQISLGIINNCSRIVRKQRVTE